VAGFLRKIAFCEKPSPPRGVHAVDSAEIFRADGIFEIISTRATRTTGYFAPRIRKSNQPHYNMKLFLTALCASFMVLPAFSAECEKGKCDKDKKEQGTVAECDKCKKGEEKKEEGTVAECDKCKKGEEKKEEGTIAECDKCKKGEEKKEEGTIAECDKCKKGEEKKEEGTIA
jgi:ribosomal protein L37AE/L43A